VTPENSSESLGLRLNLPAAEDLEFTHLLQDFRGPTGQMSQIPISRYISDIIKHEIFNVK